MEIGDSRIMEIWLGQVIHDREEERVRILSDDVARESN